MASSHVPGEDQQGQTIYPDPANYDHLFLRANSQYNATPTWDQFNQITPNVLPQQPAQTQPSPTQQPWHYNTQPQQPYSTATQPYGNASQRFQPTPSLQYAQFNSSHAPLSNYGQQHVVDPALGGQEPVAIHTQQQQQQHQQQQQSPYQQGLRTVAPQGQPTVSPQDLQPSSLSLQNPRPTNAHYQIPKSTTEQFSQRVAPAPQAFQPVSNPKYEVPKGKAFGSFIMVDSTALANSTKSAPLNKYVNMGRECIHLATNRTALPIYNARLSVKEMKKTSIGSKKIIDRNARKPSSASRMLLGKSATGRISTGSPSSLHRDMSDSDSDTDSSDESDDYTDDDEDDYETSPLPAARPGDPHQAVRYDIIKASWLPRRAQPGGEKVRTSLAELWDVLSTIQKRWRTDSKAVSEAEEQKKTGELPVLKSRVSSQRDLLQSALKSTLEFCHPDILSNFGQVKPFLYLCYQFLANRLKEQDYDGGLPSVLYEVMARASATMTTELIEETKLMRGLNAMKKHANEANRALIQKIIDGAAAGSKKPKVNTPPRDDAASKTTTVSKTTTAPTHTTLPTNAKRPAPQPAGRPAEGPAAKKLKALEPPATLPKRTLTASAPSGARTAPAPVSVPQKRPGEKAAAAPVKARGNQVVNKPSAFFSALNAATKKVTPTPPAGAASKANSQQKPSGVAAVKDRKSAASKPGFSFAETMAQLMEPTKEVKEAPKPEKQLLNETREERARRLRKESRRHLRVTFKPDASLVSIRTFSHVPEEEEGHDENFVRDAGDIGGEGRMFKQHRDQEEDDDDEEPEMSYHEWKTPTFVDFSVVDPSERARNFEPFGGGERKPECPEKEENERLQNSTLMAVYLHPSDIPPSPREPLEEASGPSPPVSEFGRPPQIVWERSPKAPAPAAVPNVDLNFLQSVVSQLSANTSGVQPAAVQNLYAPPPPPVVAPNPPGSNMNLAAILSAIGAGAGAMAPVAMPTQGPNGAPDLTALMAMIQAGAAPPPGGIPPMLPLWPQFAQPFQQPPPPQQQQAQADTGFQAQQHYNQQASGGAGVKRQREDGSNQGGDRGPAAFKKLKGAVFNGERPHKVVPCRFFQAGKCTKGDDCTFIHDRNMM